MLRHLGDAVLWMRLMNLKAALIVLAVILPVLPAWSQDHPKVEVSLDYSWMHFAAIDYETKGFEFYRAYNLNGGGGAVVFNFGRMLGLKADFQGYGSQSRTVIVPAGNPFLPAGGEARVQGNLTTYMFGPQVGKRYGIFRPYAHALVGGAHSNVYSNAWNSLNFTQAGGSPSSNAFAANVGVGLDLELSRRFAFRPFEVSYLYSNFSNKLTNNQNSFRYLGGVVLNFGGAIPVPPTANCSAS